MIQPGCIAVLNAGSSSIKFALYEAGHVGTLLFRGQVERLELEPSLSVTDATFNQAYFGINAVQSFNPGYAQYYPGAGLRSIGVGASAQWRVVDKLTFVAFSAYNRLTDIPAASPLVTSPTGSPNQFVAGVALSWRFEW